MMRINYFLHVIDAQIFEVLHLSPNFKSLSYKGTCWLSQNIQAVVIDGLLTHLRYFDRAERHKQFGIICYGSGVN